MIQVNEEQHRREIEARARALRIQRIHDRITDPEVGAWGAAQEIDELQRKVRELESAK